MCASLSLSLSHTHTHTHSQYHIGGNAALMAEKIQSVKPSAEVSIYKLFNVYNVIVPLPFAGDVDWPNRS